MKKSKRFGKKIPTFSKEVIDQSLYKLSDPKDFLDIEKLDIPLKLSFKEGFGDELELIPTSNQAQDYVFHNVNPLQDITDLEKKKSPLQYPRPCYFREF